MRAIILALVLALGSLTALATLPSPVQAQVLRTDTVTVQPVFWRGRWGGYYGGYYGYPGSYGYYGYPSYYGYYGYPRYYSGYYNYPYSYYPGYGTYYYPGYTTYYWGY
jgi:hypothetical protein